MLQPNVRTTREPLQREGDPVVVVAIYSPSPRFNKSTNKGENWNAKKVKDLKHFLAIVRVVGAAESIDEPGFGEVFKNALETDPNDMDLEPIPCDPKQRSWNDTITIMKRLHGCTHDSLFGVIEQHIEADKHELMNIFAQSRA
ncbi:unnamed protein product [Cylindrotheca closterium]|uniref:Uncharacterized protein n=1 Tax=Cylindrotheca closterium TaxID=2856 RepID=A0AAD2FWT3_9STRA|nr:unnamed protein product [Cylindrotheca closterium]